MDAKPGLLCLCCCFALLLLGLSPQQQQVVADQLGAPYVNCLRNSTSGLSSTFTRNLNTALRNLTNLSSQGTENATTIVGSSGQDMVYAAFQCRGDMSLNLCRECMQNATVRLPQHECPNAVEARIQLDGCFLRYGNKSFFVLDTTFVQGYCSYAKTSDAAVLSTIRTLVGNVTSQAPKQGGFASDSASAEYAAAQCLGYLTQSDCAKCLSAVPYRTVCDSTLGEQVHLASCYYRHEPYPFLEEVSAESLPPSPSSAERPAPSPVSVSDGGARLVPPPGDSAQPHDMADVQPEVDVQDILLNHEEAQRIYKEEEVRVPGVNLMAYAQTVEDDSELEGDPLSYKDCRKLCPNYIVRNHLFRRSGNAKGNPPLKISDLQHTILARHLLQRFIKVYRCKPNNNQVAIYFVQQCYCYYVLGKKVNWDDQPTDAGVGKGCIGDRVQAREENLYELPLKKGFTYLPEETAALEQLASQGQDLESRGESPDMLRQQCRQLAAEEAAPSGASRGGGGGKGEGATTSAPSGASRGGGGGEGEGATTSAPLIFLSLIFLIFYVT